MYILINQCCDSTLRTNRGPTIGKLILFGNSVPRRHIYIYREPAPLAAECQLRNRKSGKDVRHVAKQNVVTLDDSDEIIGAQASNKSVFVVTKNDVFTIRVNM